MNDLRNLFRDASHYLGGYAGALALSFISFPIFARALSVSDYGMMSLAFQVSAMAVVVSKMGLQNSIQRFYPQYSDSSQPGALKTFCSTLLFGAVLFSISVAILFVIGLEAVPDSLVSPVLKKVLLTGSGLIFVRGVQPMVMNFLRAQRRTKAFNGYDVAAKAVSLAFVCLLLFTWNRSVRAVLTGTIAIEFLSLVFLIILVLPKGTIATSAVDLKLLRSFMAFGFPLVGYELAAVILDSGDRILVQHYLGFQDLGYYSCAYNITNYIGMALMSPVNLAVVPIYIKMWETRGREETGAFLSGALNKFMIAVMCVLAGVTVTARSAVIVLGSQKLQQAAPLLPVLVLGILVYTLHIFFNAGLIIHKKTVTMLRIVGFCALLNIGLNIWLIPRIGLQGAALATLVSYVVFLGLIARASLAILPLRVDVGAWLRYACAAGLAVLIVLPVHFSSHFVNLVARGTLCLCVYLSALYALDRPFRKVVDDFLRARKVIRQVSLTEAGIPRSTPDTRKDFPKDRFPLSVSQSGTSVE